MLNSGCDFVCVVGPEFPRTLIQQDPRINILDDPGRGAAAAINVGLKHLIEALDCDFVSWIGDDDYLTSNLREVSDLLSKSTAGTIVGSCKYLDGQERLLQVARPRKRDVFFLELWSNRLPQPGSLFKSDALLESGFLDENLRYAFDQDLFHRIKRKFGILVTRKELAVYRWHSSSLSSAGAEQSEMESHDVRMKYAPKHLSWFAALWFSLYRATRSHWRKRSVLP